VIALLHNASAIRLKVLFLIHHADDSNAATARVHRNARNPLYARFGKISDLCPALRSTGPPQTTSVFAIMSLRSTGHNLRRRASRNRYWCAAQIEPISQLLYKLCAQS
jgi:hypothetical protein